METNYDYQMVLKTKHSFLSMWFASTKSLRCMMVGIVSEVAAQAVDNTHYAEAYQ